MQNMQPCHPSRRRRPRITRCLSRAISELDVVTSNRSISATQCLNDAEECDVALPTPELEDYRPSAHCMLCTKKDDLIAQWFVLYPVCKEYYYLHSSASLGTLVDNAFRFFSLFWYRCAEEGKQGRLHRNLVYREQLPARRVSYVVLYASKT